jgi:hypothetical protein
VVVDKGRASEDFLTCCDDGLAYCFCPDGSMKEYTCNKALLTTEITDICKRHKSFSFSLFIVNPLTGETQGDEIKLELNKMESPKRFSIKFDQSARRFSCMYSNTDEPDNGEPVEEADGVKETKMLTDEFRNDYQPFRRRSFNYAKGLKNLETRIAPPEPRSFSNADVKPTHVELMEEAAEYAEEVKKRRRRRDRVLGALGVLGIGTAAILANPITQRMLVKSLGNLKHNNTNDD